MLPASSSALRLALCLFVPVSVASAQFEPAWTSTAAPTTGFSSQSRLVAIDANGAVLAVGLSAFVGASSTLVAVQYDPAGAVQWTTPIFPTPALYDPRAIAVSTSGRCAIAGRRNDSAGVTTSATMLAVVGPTGAVEWSRIGGSDGVSTYEDVEFDAAGDVYVCGAEGPAGRVRKFDATGTMQWESPHAGRYRYDALVLDPSGDVYAVGSGLGYSASVVRFSGADGSVVWNTPISSYSADQPFRMLRTPAGDVVVAGEFELPSAPFVPLHGAAALDALGNVLWTTDVPGLRPQHIRGIAMGRDELGRTVLVGGGQGAGAGVTRIQAAALDANGSVAWSRTLDIPGASVTTLPPTVAVDLVGTVYTVASILATPSDPEHGVVCAFGSAGEQAFAWDPRTDDPVNYPRKLRVVAGGANGALVALGDTTANRFFTTRLDRTSTPFCFGDGSATACPCGNSSAVGQNAGCAHSLGSGARLVDAGTSSVAHDTFALLGTSMPNSSALYFQGTQESASVFGDGLACANGTLTRLGVKSNVGGASRYPDPGDAPVSVRGLVPGPSTVRTYQVWFRNSAAFCTSSAFNLSNGLRVTWTN